MGIGNRMESLSYLTCHGFAIAASTMVGQNLGAKRPHRAQRAAWMATGMDGFIMVTAAVGLCVFAPQLIGFFSVLIIHDDELIVPRGLFGGMRISAPQTSTLQAWAIRAGTSGPDLFFYSYNCTSI